MGGAQVTHSRLHLLPLLRHRAYRGGGDMVVWIESGEVVKRGMEVERLFAKGIGSGAG